MLLRVQIYTTLLIFAILTPSSFHRLSATRAVLAAPIPLAARAVDSTTLDASQGHQTLDIIPRSSNSALSEREIDAQVTVWRRMNLGSWAVDFPTAAASLAKSSGGEALAKAAVAASAPPKSFLGSGALTSDSTASKIKAIDRLSQQILSPRPLLSTDSSVDGRVPHSSIATNTPAPTRAELPKPRGRGRPRKPIADPETQKQRERNRDSLARKIACLNNPENQHIKKLKIDEVVATNKEYRSRHREQCNTTRRKYRQNFEHHRPSTNAYPRIQRVAWKDEGAAASNHGPSFSTEQPGRAPSDAPMPENIAYPNLARSYQREASIEPAVGKGSSPQQPDKFSSQQPQSLPNSNSLSGEDDFFDELPPL